MGEIQSLEKAEKGETRNNKNHVPYSAGPGTKNRIVYLKERNFNMLKKDLILRNPLRLIGYETEDIG